MTAIRTRLAGLAALLLVMAVGAPVQAASKRHLLFDTYCEFSLGQPVPANAVKVTTLKVVTEGEPRVYQRYRACRGRSEALLEVKGGVIDSITVSRPGDCIAKLACVGDPYAKVAKRFRQASQTSSQIEGRTFSLNVSSQATIAFSVQAAPSRCSSGPKCGPVLKPQFVTSIYLHD